MSEPSAVVAGAGSRLNPAKRLAEPAEYLGIVSERPRDREYGLRRALLAGDMACLLLAFLAAAILTPWSERPLADLLWFIAFLPAWAVLLRAYSLYDRSARRISYSVLDDLPSLFHAVVLGTLATWLYFRLSPPAQLVLAEVVEFGILAMVGPLTARYLVRKLWGARHGPERVILVGAHSATPTLLRKIRSHPEYQLDPIGLVGTSSDKHMVDLPWLGDLGKENIDAVLARTAPDRIIICGVEGSDEPTVELLRRCHQGGIAISILPDLSDVIGPSTEFDQIEGVTMLAPPSPILSRSSALLKRAMDVSLAIIALMLASPLMAAITLTIRIEGRGPILFRQVRIGRGGRRFTLLKFRTMEVDAEQRTEELMAASRDPDWLHIDDDPRVTRIGRYLRHRSLDELPQLWNVVRGDMSLVGPRPLSERDDQGVRGWGRSRLDLVPGLTGLWQVLGRAAIPFEEMVKLDYAYVTNWSLWGDVKLMLRTIPGLVSGRGAN